MSEIPRGPDWWIATDQKWYPPESHPEFKPTPPPPPPPDTIDSPATKSLRKPNPVTAIRNSSLFRRIRSIKILYQIPIFGTILVATMFVLLAMIGRVIHSNQDSTSPFPPSVVSEMNQVCGHFGVQLTTPNSPGWGGYPGSIAQLECNSLAMSTSDYILDNATAFINPSDAQRYLTNYVNKTSDGSDSVVYLDHSSWVINCGGDCSEWASATGGTASDGGS